MYTTGRRKSHLDMIEHSNRYSSLISPSDDSDERAEEELATFTWLPEDLIVECCQWMCTSTILLLGQSCRRIGRIVTSMQQVRGCAGRQWKLSVRWAVECPLRFQWAMWNGCPLNLKTCMAVARVGNIEILSWLLYDVQCAKVVFKQEGQAKWGGQSEWGGQAEWEGQAEWGIESKRARQAIWFSAIMGGQLDTLKWLHERGFLVYLSERGIAIAAREGYLEIVKWLYGVGTWNTRENMEDSAAAYGGHVSILRYLRAKRFLSWGSGTIMSNSWPLLYALENGQVEAARWLGDNGCPFDYEQQYPQSILSLYPAFEFDKQLDTQCNMYRAISQPSVSNWMRCYELGCRSHSAPLHTHNI